MKLNKMPGEAKPPTTAALMAGGGASVVAISVVKHMLQLYVQQCQMWQNGNSYLARCFVCLKKHHETGLSITFEV